ncbi:MAG: ClpXP protease specificity-enhancing factor [Sideroxydans sp.]|nr:ClpXP protease specificity-enhancing factor [Sideroxydans sp.]
MSEISTRPYLIRALHHWCEDSGFTPYLAVKVDANTQVPMAFVKDGEIVLNLGVAAVRHLAMENDYITCEGRFSGTPFRLIVPVSAVIGIFAKETGQGLVFQADEPQSNETSAEQAAKPAAKKPTLTIVK